VLQAGTGVSTITPPLGTSLSGSFEDRPAKTVHDDLHVRALVLDDGTTRVALVLCDIICISRETADRAKDVVSARSGIAASQVMISCTHTHTAPATVPLLASEPDPACLDWLAVRIADAVAIASANLGPARIASGATDVANVCFNRRFRMKDGTVVFNPGIRNPDIVEVTGPVDPQVTALLVERPDGTPIALWANLSLHYVGTDDPYAVSADYYGHYAGIVARTLGDACVGMLTNGTSGNINNVDVSGATQPERPDVRAAQVAGAVAGAAIAATRMAPPDDAPCLDARLVPFEVTRRPITERDIALARDILDDAGDPAAEISLGFSFVTGQPIPSSQIRTYAHEVLELATMPESRATVLQVIRIGDLVLVGLPGEIFVEFGLAIKAASPATRTAVVSLANDYVGYVPTVQAFAEGGYETWAARSAWPAPGTGEAMVEALLAQIDQG
jgi:hypothetical protein